MTLVTPLVRRSAVLAAAALLAVGCTPGQTGGDPTSQAPVATPASETPR